MFNNNDDRTQSVMGALYNLLDDIGKEPEAEQMARDTVGEVSWDQAIEFVERKQRVDCQVLPSLMTVLDKPRWEKILEGLHTLKSIEEQMAQAQANQEAQNDRAE